MYVDPCRGRMKYELLNKMLRIYAHMRFAFVTFDVMNAVVDPDDGTVTIRWRIKTNTTLNSFITNFQVNNNEVSSRHVQYNMSQM